VHTPPQKADGYEPAGLDADTIAAVATPPGRGGIGVVRISGPEARTIMRTLTGIGEPRPRYAYLAHFRDSGGSSIDQGIAVHYPAPRSFTGEDVVELQGHGGPVVMDMLLAVVIGCGARVARPGEFTERAFLNGKIDLAQAEAVADLIDSASSAAARNAMRSLQGVFSTRITAIAEALRELRVFVEAAIDFADEEIDFLQEAAVGERTRAVLAQVEAIIADARQGVLLTEGIGLALAGRPNAGKSSLLNRLAGYERAIVTSMPGTTRDTLHEQITLDGLPIRIVDTAGLRRTTDLVELEGIRRAQEAFGHSDRILLISDAMELADWELLIEEQCLPRERITVVLNKIDLSGHEPGCLESGDRQVTGDLPVVRVSALTGAGIDALIDHLKRVAGYRSNEGSFSARRRHLTALQQALQALVRGLAAIEAQGAGELLAEDLRAAHDSLGEITGRVSADALLGDIFSSFCIGK
jgi:tRNA modification GTPase